MRRYLLDKILDRQDKYDELVQGGGAEVLPAVLPLWILLSRSEQNLRRNPSSPSDASTVQLFDKR